MNPRSQRLIRVSKAKRDEVRLWREGAHHVATGGHPIDTLQRHAVTARWRFARLLKREGSRLLSLQPPMYRLAIARFYYAMYHAMRSVVYLEYDGDDHEQHLVLPTKQVAGLPAESQWQNKLKNARTYRNSADYDPYPISDTAWLNTASALEQDAEDLLTLSRAFLNAKGCHL